MFNNTVLPWKNHFLEFKMKNENSWHKCQVISRARKAAVK